MNRRHFLLGSVAFAALTACATPQQQCVNTATYDLRVLDSLIAETEGNLQRGFAYQESIAVTPQWQFCGGGWGGYNLNVGTQMCWVNQPTPVQQPVAIDVNAEKAKLNSLRQRRAQQERATQAALAQCQAQFPQ